MITAVILTSLVFIGACKQKDDEAPGPGLMKYFVGLEVDDEYYMVPAKDISSGKISVLGNGIEDIAHHAVVKDGYLYAINTAESTLDKYKITETGITKEGAISTTPIMSGSFARYTDLTETNDIILMNFPNSSGQAPYAIVDLATFTVESYGSFQMPDIKHYKPTWARTLVSGTKAYVAAEYTVPSVYGDIPDSLITIVYDYPAFTNPTILVNPASSGSVAGYRTRGTFKDELGDIYQCNLRSKQWSINEEDVDDAPAVFVRIKNGQYDDYVLDVTSHFDEPVSIWNAWYAGNGIAYANIIKESDLGAWANLQENYGQLCMIDLYNKTVTKLNIPKAPLNEIFSLNSVDNGKFYIPVCIKGGAANIYEITIGGGANDFKVGAELDGNNVYAPSLNILK
jgi:hypothetical protein